MKGLCYKAKRNQYELKVSDSRFTLSLKKGTLGFGKNLLRLDICHWEEREIIWGGLAMGPVIGRLICESRLDLLGMCHCEQNEVV